MRNLSRFFLLSAMPLMMAASALAQNITVSGQLSTYPVLVQAHNTGCNGIAPVSFGYTVDNQSTFVRAQTPYDIDYTDPAITVGAHTLHLKSWTQYGICPVLSININVASGSTTAPISIPSNAIASSGLLGASSWKWNHDAGTPGTSIGYTTYPVSSPSVDNLAREFSVSYSDHGGEIYHLSFANDSSATHFVYDTYIYLTDPSQAKNIEMDVNQVIPNGQTMILGTQCSGYSGTWEYTVVWSGGPHWKPSNLPCDPTKWTAKTWHHVQIASHRDQYGNATYDWVTFDGVQSYFSGATGADALSLGWKAGDLLLNFQLDGSSVYSGSIQTYLDKLTIYRW
jgi:hypothetical protein